MIVASYYWAAAPPPSVVHEPYLTMLQTDPPSAVPSTPISRSLSAHKAIYLRMAMMTWTPLKVVNKETRNDSRTRNNWPATTFKRIRRIYQH